MPIIVSENDSTRAPHPSGSYQMVCCDVIDLGIVDTAFGKKDCLRVVWQSEEIADDGKRHIVSKRYTKSLHEKAALRHALESWRGKPFTPAELKEFDVEKLIGANAYIQILVEKNATSGKEYGNVKSIMQLPRNMAKMTVHDYQRKPAEAPPAAPEPEPPVEDDVPF